MAKKHTKILRLDGKLCRFGKISNNLERHGDDYVTAFTIPVTELMLTKAELNAFMRDKYCHQSWYDTTKGNQAAEPMPWWGGESFYVSEAFEADKGSIIVSGDRELEFESEGDPKEDTYKPAIVVSKIVLTPRTGGLTEFNGSIYVRPGIGKTNLALQDHQHREVKLTLIDGRVAEREKRQPQLPMGEPPADSSSTAPAAETENAASTAAH
jgi:hypothetical protein